jgi:flagellin
VAREDTVLVYLVTKTAQIKEDKIMVVQHNLSAMNSNRMLGITQGTLSKSTEKLSSGYKINRAADDAAGLSISEKMRKQIRGLTQASSNAEDGISAVQTAEGALAEVQDMLQRMNELAVKSANGTNSESDRSYIQDEIDQLTTEIDRVAETTKFNETYLLKGDNSLDKGYSFSYGKASTAVTATATFAADGASGLSIEVSFEDPSQKLTNATTNNLLKSMKNQGLSFTTSYDGTLIQSSMQLNGDAASNYKVVTDTYDQAKGLNVYKIYDLQDNLVSTVTTKTAQTINGTTTLLAKDDATLKAQQSDAELQVFYDADGNAVSANALSNYFTTDETGAVKVKADAGKLYDAIGRVQDKAALATMVGNGDVKSTRDLTSALNIKFQVGADTSSANKISINIDAMSAKGLGINGLKVDGTDSDNADSAVTTISEAIQKVSKQRSALGAVQNRLEHTINNLDNVVENTTSAESAIRDTDMATEMVTYSNANILSQAGQAMLAQSNQSNQGVLSLLG